VSAIDVYLEVGARRTFAGALECPGWTRAGRNEVGALEALLEYGPRYRAAVGRSATLVLPKGVGDVKVVERLEGGSGTDFGVPGAIPAYDRVVPDAAELERTRRIMLACWAAFDGAAQRARGPVLPPSGPRGGGRSLAKMTEHVIGADGAYLGSLGVSGSGRLAWPELRQAFLDGLGARARGELPEVGPRGGARWPARYAARRAAWHLLDHAWEIEDRL